MCPSLWYLAGLIPTLDLLRWDGKRVSPGGSGRSLKHRICEVYLQSPSQQVHFLLDFCFYVVIFVTN